MIWGWGSKRFLRYLALYELKGVGHTPWEPWTVSMNASYQNEQQYLWFRGGVPNGS